MLTTLITFILLSCAAPSNPIIRDLYGDNTQFQAQLQHWTTYSFTSTAKFSSCDGTLLLGGYKRSGRGARAVREYTNLPAHVSISYRLELWYLDTWDNERINLQFDSLVVPAFSRNITGPKNLCGYSNPDGYVIVQGKVKHSEGTLTLEISSTLDEESYNESWGVREISLILEQATVSASTLCGNAYFMEIPVGKQCKCADSDFLASASVCKRCPDRCTSCSGTTGEDCYECNSTHSDYQVCDCPINKVTYQNKCLDTCPTGSYASGNKCVQCPENCESCTATRCLACKTGFKKTNDLICYPVCGPDKKNTLSGQCQKPAEDYENTNCLNKLSQGKDDRTCNIPRGQTVIFEINYDKTKHYYTQVQGTTIFWCKEKVISRPMAKKGCYIASLIMISKTAGVQKLGGISFDSPQSIGSDLSPLITTKSCNFEHSGPDQFSEFPYKHFNSFAFFKEGADFTKGQIENLAQVYNTTVVDQAFGNLLACENQCSVILVWLHTYSDGRIGKHATMLTKLETSTADGSIEEIFMNTKITFADPQSIEEPYRERNANTFCFKDSKNNQRYCLCEFLVYKRKHS